MSKLNRVHRCHACGTAHARWSGRCTNCGGMELPAGGGHQRPQPGPGAGGSSCGAGRADDFEDAVPIPLGEVDLSAHQPIPTGISELDRVLAGGLLPGSGTLVGGEPGTGKSTLLLQALASMAANGRRGLLVAAEEAAPQVRRRAARLGADVPGVFVLEATQLPGVEQAVASVQPDVVVVDSVQAVSDPEVASPAGSLAQVRACAHRLVAMAKSSGCALVLVGHVTKEGALAGPRALEHLVDTVLSFEGDRYLSLRALRAVKHRFGPTGETGLFDMAETGLTSVTDPSSLFLGDRLDGAPGSAVTVPIEGYRALLVEVQALVGRQSAVPRRFVTGLDAGRVGFLVAVLDRHCGVPVGDRDIYVSVAGGRGRANRPPTSPCAWRWRRPCQVLLCARNWWPSGRLASVARLAASVACRSGWPRRSGSGFSDALVPGSAKGAKSPAPVPLLRQLPASCLSEALSIAFGSIASGDGPTVKAWPRKGGPVPLAAGP